jgi:mannan endo-1,4-beta-mannosidase
MFPIIFGRLPRCLVLATSFTTAGLTAASIEPANTNANQKARAILAYFHELSAKTERPMLSGQFTEFGRGASRRLLDQIHEKTGKWPAMVGFDYADFSNGSLTWEIPNRLAREYWKQGGLITVSAHVYNPANPKGGGQRDAGVDLKTLLSEGTPTHDRWMQELDLLAKALDELQKASVVVLWRPFHEMNGGWFWWGAKEPETFIAVWRHMFHYFTNTKKLNNLLWVYGPNHGQRTAAYYAGDRYVDIVGLDAYTDYLDPEHVKGYPEVAQLGKPFGFTEYGPHAAQNPPGDYDYRRFAEGVFKNFPQTVFFMSWGGKWSLARNNNVREFLNNPRVINRDDLPKGLAGNQ